MRIGIGYDIHPLAPDRPLVLGGVELDHHLGLYGHSDADALVHALCDAILGALALGDLGEHFPETPELAGISSLVLLERTAALAAAEGDVLANADCVVHAERPNISGRRREMERRMAGAAGVDPGAVSVKATRGEGMGPVGEGRAIAAQAVVLMRRAEEDGR